MIAISRKTKEDYTLLNAPDDLEVTYLESQHVGQVLTGQEEVTVTAKELREIVLNSFAIRGTLV